MLCWGRIGWSWGCGLPLKDWELRSHINVFVCLCNDSMEVMIHKKNKKIKKGKMHVQLWVVSLALFSILGFVFIIFWGGGLEFPSSFLRCGQLCSPHFLSLGGVPSSLMPNISYFIHRKDCLIPFLTTKFPLNTLVFLNHNQRGCFPALSPSSPLVP